MKKASAKRSTPPSGAAKGTGRRTATGAAIPATAARRKRKATGNGDEIAPEYDFRGARPNPYAARYVAGATAVVLDPDVAAAFPSAARVNEVLRAVAGILQPPPPVKRGRSRRSA